MKTTMKTTEILVAELEALELGSPRWVDRFTAAAEQNTSDRYAAERVLFPIEIVPVPSDAIHLFAWYIQRFSVANFPAELETLHQRASATHPAVAGLARTWDALRDVENSVAAAGTVTPDRHETFAAAAARAGAVARRAYQRAIAGQLADHTSHELAPAARAYLAADSLADRLDAAKVRRDQHVAAELARQEAERVAAEQAAAAERERAEVDAEFEQELQLMAGAGRRINDEERARIRTVVATRRRLRASKVDSVRIGRNIFDPRELARALGEPSPEACADYIAALDRAEAS